MDVMSLREKQLVEEHLNLVSAIIYSKRLVNEHVQGLGYEDLYQTGCEALCHAAMTYKESQGASFSTYAYTVIKNCLISLCQRTTGKQASICYLDAPVAGDDKRTLGDILADKDHTLEDKEIIHDLMVVEQQLHGIARKGVEALRLRCMGHTGTEIAGYYGVKTNHVTAWISRALRKLQAEQYFAYLQ